jgi:hypothetical protein
MEPKLTDLERIQRALEVAAKAAPTNGEIAAKAAPTEVAPTEKSRLKPHPPEREQLAGDASFIVVRGISRDLSAQAIAEYLLKSNRADTVVIAEHDGIILDNALERVGLPRTGFQHHSRFRAVAQVLKLCMGLVWEPVSPHLLLQFLIHPVGPLPKHARSTLAEAVADEPGIGGTAWRKALTMIAERMAKFERSATEPKKSRLKPLPQEPLHKSRCHKSRSHSRPYWTTSRTGSNASVSRRTRVRRSPCSSSARSAARIGLRGCFTPSRRRAKPRSMPRPKRRPRRSSRT